MPNSNPKKPAWRLALVLCGLLSVALAPPRALAVKAVGDPSFSLHPDGRLEIFTRGADSSIWHKWQKTPGRAWSDWASFGGGLTGPASVGRNADGRLEF